MQRSKKILLLSHCLLNANAKVERIALYQGALTDLIVPLIERGYGFLQLPCPEMLHGGMARWGQVKEQYDTPFFRRHCETLLRPILDQIIDYRAHGYEIVGCIGVDGSPSCGIVKTCRGKWGGELSGNLDLQATVDSVRLSEERGVFMQIFGALLEQNGVALSFYAIDESNPTASVQHILKEL